MVNLNEWSENAAAQKWLRGQCPTLRAASQACVNWRKGKGDEDQRRASPDAKAAVV
jgi:hypothetical protein